MQQFILEFIGEYGSFAVFLLILIENLFPPIPSEVILTFGGFMTTCTRMTAAEVIAASTLGSLAGAVFLYFAGYLIPDSLFKKLLSGPVGRTLKFRPEDVELAKGWFLKKGQKAVFFCRLVPIVRSLISIPAGLSGMAFGPFLLYTAAGSLIWNTVLVFAGRIAGNSWEAVSGAMGAYSDIFLMALGAGMLFAVFLHNICRKRKES